VFLRLDISCVFAASPRYLLLGPKPTSDLKYRQILDSLTVESRNLRCSPVRNLVCDLEDSQYLAIDSKLVVFNVRHRHHDSAQPQ